MRNASDYSASIPAKTDAGTYSVWYYVKGDENHSDWTAAESVQVTIGKAVPAAYMLTVYYVYTDGTKAEETYTEPVAKGSAYSVASPEIPGLDPDRKTVAGAMGGQDVTVTVVYRVTAAAAEAWAKENGLMFVPE